MTRRESVTEGAAESADCGAGWAGIRAIVCDVDGTLTAGTIAINDCGQETKEFCVRDGLAVSLWRESGGRLGVVTGRQGLALRHRLEELGVDAVVQGSRDKVAALDTFCVRWRMTRGECAFVGDDLPDLAAMLASGLAVAVAGADPEVSKRAAYTTIARPGHGALREVIELALKAQGKWEAVISRFEHGSPPPAATRREVNL